MSNEATKTNVHRELFSYDHFLTVGSRDIPVIHPLSRAIRVKQKNGEKEYTIYVVDKVGGIHKVRLDRHVQSLDHLVEEAETIIEQIGKTDRPWNMVIVYREDMKLGKVILMRADLDLDVVYCRET